uniref:DDE Tnp4 domain-containing protein n=1 Tax=Denticeps clupeoides TaxID=299321 RepID=A0AAY4D9W8_9TELE
RFKIHRETVKWQVLSTATTTARRGYRQRVYVERTKPLEQYTTEELYVQFRFGKAEYLMNPFRPKLQHRTQRSVLVKSAVCDVVRDVSIALASLVNELVSFPKDNQIGHAKHSFFLLGNMPNTIGAIDCTHVHIQAPRENEFINRKGRHSINVQLGCDADLCVMLITNCVVKWPGSVRDPRILRETNTPAQTRFNTAHCRARCVIECLNGVLKRRFACLNYLRAEPQKACNITLACIVLHNIATKRNVPLCPLETLTNLLHSARTQANRTCNKGHNS